MPTLVDLREVFRETRTLLNSAVGKYEVLHLIGIDETEDNKLEYLVKDISEGFYYKEDEDSQGDITETILIVAENPTVETAIQDSTLVELVDTDGSFIRCAINGKKRPKKPSFQWTLTVKPNNQDKRVIT